MTCPDCQYPLPAESVPDQIAHWLQHALVEAGMDATIASIIAEPLLQTSLDPDRLARAFAPVLMHPTSWASVPTRTLERLEREAELGRAALAFFQTRGGWSQWGAMVEMLRNDRMHELARQLDTEDT